VVGVRSGLLVGVGNMPCRFSFAFLNLNNGFGPFRDMGLRVPVRVGVILGGLLLPLALLSTSRLPLLRRIITTGGYLSGGSVFE
jgi:hypothetical protein